MSEGIPGYDRTANNDNTGLDWQLDHDNDDEKGS